MPSDPPSEEFSEPEETTLHGVENMPAPMRSWARSQSVRMRKVEKHFEPRGMVFELHSDWSAITKSFNFWIKVGPILGAVLIAGISALMWLIHSETSQKPPSAEDVAREVVHQQQEQKK